ncbi:MAG: hypothetical protein RLY86_1107 [Pseudomonadota bacterium]|jgi:acetyl esterase/lipase
MMPPPVDRDRRRLLRGIPPAILAAALPAPPAAASDLPPTGPDPGEVIALWPGNPPGSPVPAMTQTVLERQNPWGLRDRAVKWVTRPTMTVFRPDRPKGAAVLLIPGGGYAHVVVDKEGFETARLLAGRGVTVFVLLYRLPGDGWRDGPATPLQDAQRAIRLIRARAGEFGIDPARVGVQGFSAGGHLAALLSTRFADPVYDPVDGADAQPARPDHACLMYPVITLDGPAAHPGSRRAMVGEVPAEGAVARWSADRGVGPDTPPTFLVHALDDRPVPPENGLMMLAALRRAGVPVEAHFFQEGGHGFGLRGIADKPVAAWPALYLDWARRLGQFP